MAVGWLKDQATEYDHGLIGHPTIFIASNYVKVMPGHVGRGEVSYPLHQ